MRFYYSKGDWHRALSMFRGDGNRMRHESLGISRNAISVKSRIGAFEKTRFKRVKLDGILEKRGKITFIMKDKEKKKSSLKP